MAEVHSEQSFTSLDNALIDDAQQGMQPSYNHHRNLRLSFIALITGCAVLALNHASTTRQKHSERTDAKSETAALDEAASPERMVFPNANMMFDFPFTRRRRTVNLDNGMEYHATAAEVELATLMSVTETFTPMAEVEDCWNGRLENLTGFQSTNTLFRHALTNKNNMLGYFEGKANTSCAGSCVLSWQGTRSYGDWVRDAQIYTTNWCGLNRVHAGFAKETDERLATPEFSGPDGIKTALIKGQQDGTCKEIYFIGQSMGAAAASLLAYCSQQPQDQQPDDVRDIILPHTPVKLYAYGSPAFQWLYPEDVNVGGIDGLRYYTKGNDGMTDLVPGLLQKFGFSNPKIPVVELDLDANRSTQWNEPMDSVVTLPIAPLKQLDMKLHNMKSRYLAGIKESYRSSSKLDGTLKQKKSSTSAPPKSL